MKDPIRKIITFLLKSSLLILISFNFQSCQETTSPIQENIKTQVKQLRKFNNNDFELVKKIAKSMSIWLKGEQHSQILESAIKNSKKKQQILEASTFLNKTITIKNKTTSLRDELKLLVSENDKVDFEKSIKNLPFGLIDIYFPQKQWRKEWKSGDDLLVASIGSRNEKDLSDILAYDLNGNEVYLDVDKIPETPTLVIYPSEKKGNYKIANEDKHYYNTLKKSSSIASTNSENGTNYTVYYKLTITYFEPADAGHDPWWTPDLEIYFETSEYVDDHFTPYGRVGDVYECETGEDNTINLQILYTSNSLYKIKIRAWDEDDGSADDLVAHGYYWELNGNSVEYFTYSSYSGNQTRKYTDNGANGTDYITLKQTEHYEYY